MITDDKELAFRSSLWRLFSTHLINQYGPFINEQIDKTIEEANKNGITDYMSWMRWIADGKKKGAKKNAKPKGTGTGNHVAEKQNGRKGHSGRDKRGGDL